MAWTAPATAVTGDVIPAAFWNTNGRDNLNALHDVLAGAAQAFGTVLYPTNDNSLYLQNTASGVGGPLLAFDTGDYLLYTRADNTYRLRVGSADKQTIDSAGNVTAAGRFFPNNDAAAWFGQTSTATRYGINVDTGDWQDFDRPSNVFRWIINSLLVLNLDGNGQLTGKGFYDSGAFSVAASANVVVNHGLGARPRFVFGYWVGTGSPTDLDPSSVTSAQPLMHDVGATATKNIAWANVSQISIRNNDSVARYVRVYAML